ncbi:DUF7619 domain-containing protein [Aureispira anguillae]|uniref:T9SS type A sorting domain-containing protein n=1 Tax=Aureispira anguillae TaxID=2864201 RepID=A0A915YEA6_9BACT|nr:T9SS type A sorting domain-containing protein [Aureispira anguillae]BDS11540.1 T9SS type A sorting domain-containing protein [Aureispira anguillae]
MKNKINSIFLGLLVIVMSTSLQAQFPQIGMDIDGEALGDWAGWSVSLSSDGSTFAIGAPNNDGNGFNAGHVQVYGLIGNTWVQMGNDIEGEAVGDWLGKSVSLSSDGTVLAVGGDGNDANGANAGYVRLYEWTGNAWVQLGNDIDGEAAGDLSGYSVSLSADGTIVAIGAYKNDGAGSDAGHVRLYQWTGSAWVQLGNDIDGQSGNDYFGHSVSLSADGTVVAIGAYRGGNFVGGGEVIVYEWTGTIWNQKGYNIFGESGWDWSGFSVSLNADGTVVAIGAPKNTGNGPDAGHVRIYEWAGTSWVQRGNDIDGVGADFSGISASLSADGTLLAVGAHKNNSDAGLVRLYQWTGSAWIQIGNGIAGEAVGDFSGRAISLSADGSALAVGAFYNDVNGMNSGHARIYRIGGLTGIAYKDYNQNCQKDSNEISNLPNQTFIIQPGNITPQTDENGLWFVTHSLTPGIYTITADTTQSNWQVTCPATQTFVVNNLDSFTVAPSFGFISNTPCPAPTISIHAPFLRPGFSDQKVYIKACNDYAGSDKIDSVYVIVELDSLLTVNSASLAYTSLGANRYQIYVADSLYPGECIDFWMSTTLSTHAILGQTLCLNAELYPVASCALDSIPNPYPLGQVSPCLSSWDQSSLDIEATCLGDSVRFVVYNTGAPNHGDMNCFAPLRVYLDGLLISLDSIQLAGGDSAVFTFEGNGQTWRLETNQHPLHPGNSNPSATIENCGTGNWTPGLVNSFPHDDADPFIDIFCGVVRGSYDPNDKTGFPLGAGAMHDILPNQKIEYLIRFQNTGTDTAFNIRILDTLSTDFNIFSVQSGVSSHDYTFKIHDSRVLEWTFMNIMLADSNTNEPLSHGFITFEVEQNPNLPNGTLLENNAGIYFDFNAPIITNTSQHTVNDNIILITSRQKIALEKELNIKLYPNPTSGLLHIEKQNNEKLEVMIINQLGSVLKHKTILRRNDSIDLEELPIGIYFITLSNGKKSLTEKVVKQ